MNPEAIPAVVLGAMTILAGVWKILDFARDQRVKLAEGDVLEGHKKLLDVMRENAELKVKIARLEAQARPLS